MENNYCDFFITISLNAACFNKETNSCPKNSLVMYPEFFGLNMFRCKKKQIIFHENELKIEKVSLKLV